VRQRAWAAVAGLAALASAAGGVVGNHLPWPSVLDEHPLWLAAAFFGLAAVLGVTTTALWFADSSNSEPVDPAVERPTTASRDVAIGGVVAASGGAAVATGTGAIAVGAGASLTLAGAQPPAAAPLPIQAAEFCEGRDAAISDGAAALSQGRTLLLLGPPGIGKSTVLARVLTDPLLTDQYGPDRSFLVPVTVLTPSNPWLTRWRFISGCRWATIC
jgi:hypothetical protein